MTLAVTQQTQAGSSLSLMRPRSVVSSACLTCLLEGWLEVHSLVPRELRYLEGTQPYGVDGEGVSCTCCLLLVRVSVIHSFVG